MELRGGGSVDNHEEPTVSRKVIHPVVVAPDDVGFLEENSASP